MKSLKDKSTSINTNTADHKSTVMKQRKSVSRREILQWTPPLAVAISLPAHAQMSTCLSTLNMVAPAPSKCSGAPPVGSALLRLTSDSADPVNPDIEIVNIAVNGAAATDTVTLPSLPTTVSDTTGADISWSGSAIDAVSCLPLSGISFDITFRCSGTVTTMNQSFDLLTVLTDALP